MPLTVTIHEDSKQACADALTRACTALGLAPTLIPVRPPGAERWMARATTATQHETPPDDPDEASVRLPDRPAR